MSTRSLTIAETKLIAEMADRLPSKERQRLLTDLAGARAESLNADGSRVIFHIEGYQHPSYHGQHAFPVEGVVTDADGAEIWVSLYADENGHLYELELNRSGDTSVISPNWNTLRLW